MDDIWTSTYTIHAYIHRNIHTYINWTSTYTIKFDIGYVKDGVKIGVYASVSVAKKQR
jgi:hypothetical protein